MMRASAIPAATAPATTSSGHFPPRVLMRGAYPGGMSHKRRSTEDRHNGRSMATVEERAGSGGKRVSEEELRGFFREMLLIRRFEEKVEERFRAGELPGFLHVAIGQEAVATGVCAALEREDVIA